MEGLDMSENNFIFPPLKPSGREREYTKYPIEKRDQIIYEYLFHGKKHRELDEEVLSLDALKTKGFQSMNILHFIGLKKEHQGIFIGQDLGLTIMELEYGNYEVDKLLEVLDRIHHENYRFNNLELAIQQDLQTSLIENDELLREGKVTYYLSKRYERNPENRLQAIHYHGLTCKVCGFDFQEYYGELGRNYIEVHHINPISTYNEEVEIDPRVDLIPLCANCHRMIHRSKDKVLRPEDLRKILKERE